MILVDTGPLVAAANRKDAYHAASVAVLTTARPPRLVPGLVIAEVSYLLARDATAAVEAEFLRSFATGFLALADLTVPDLDRNAELVEQYADLPLGANRRLPRRLGRTSRDRGTSDPGSPRLQRGPKSSRGGRSLLRPEMSVSSC